MNGDRERTSEKIDQLSRSTKKMKRTGIGDLLAEDNDKDREGMEMELGSPRVLETQEEMERDHAHIQPISYRDTLQKNNPNLNLDMRDNPIWVEKQIMTMSLKTMSHRPRKPTCPTILLTSAEKRMLREPWWKALTIRMFDKGIGYLQLKKRLKTKWALKGDFSLIDIGYIYYVTRFTNMEDYNHVILNGPWMIGDNYLIIREWVPNFVPEEDTMTKLTAWVRIQS